MKNGLFSIHVTLGDGRTGKGSGVLVMRDGTIYGGDAFLFYEGTFEIRGGILFGEVVVNQHTPSPEQIPVFGGRQVGIGFSGPISADLIPLDGTALVGRDSVVFRASLKRLCDLDEAGIGAAIAS